MILFNEASLPLRLEFSELNDTKHCTNIISNGYILQTTELCLFFFSKKVHKKQKVTGKRLEKKKKKDLWS